MPALNAHNSECKRACCRVLLNHLSKFFYSASLTSWKKDEKSSLAFLGESAVMGGHDLFEGETLTKSLSVPVREDGQLNTGTSHNTLLGQKYEDGGSILLASSSGLGWGSIITAELRRHSSLSGAAFTQPVNEVAIAVAGHAEIRRRADGVEQRFQSRPGVACVCPKGVSVRYLSITGASLDMLHLYLSKDISGGLNDRDENAEDAGLVYTGGILDPLIHQIGLAITEELQASSKSSQMMFNTLSLALSARILQRHTRSKDWECSPEYIQARKTKGLDTARLKRVVAFMEAHVSKDISLNDLAGISCLSLFHFARAFKLSTGLSPMLYFSQMRVSKAKQLLISSNISIDNLAETVGYSSGTNLARAFKKYEGVSPSHFRQHGCN